MRQYRFYSNIKWGPQYNPESGAHHVDALDYAALKPVLPSSVGPQSVQVRTAQGWQWLPDVPIHLGGISHHWHGEPV